MINFQRSKESDAEKLVVTVNLGILLTCLSDGSSDNPDVWSSHWRRRIGFLAPQHDDIWWTIQTEEDCVHAAEEIREMVLLYALPEFATKGTPEQIVAYWRTGEAAGLTETQRLRYLAELESFVSSQRKIKGDAAQ